MWLYNTLTHSSLIKTALTCIH